PVRLDREGNAVVAEPDVARAAEHLLQSLRTGPVDGRGRDDWIDRQRRVTAARSTMAVNPLVAKPRHQLAHAIVIDLCQAHWAERALDNVPARTLPISFQYRANA